MTEPNNGENGSVEGAKPEAQPSQEPQANTEGEQKPAGEAKPGDGGKQGDGFKSEESKKAVLADLAKEREARKELETKFSKLGEALGVEKPENGKTDVEQLTERLTKHEEDLAMERSARWRAEVANTKKLTAKQASFLTGSTREEIEASADELLAAFPAEANAPRNPKPDPSQGPRGGGVDIDAQIQEAQKSGDFKRVISLQNQKLAKSAGQ